MRDKSGAQRAPAGSSLGITPADHGGTATQQRAPGHDRPPAAQRAAGHGRLSAASGAPGPDVPLATTAGAPGHDRLSAVQQAPGPDVPLATTARAPRHDRLSAAHLVPDHNRSGAALAAASVPDRSHVSPPPVSAHDRSRRVPVAAGSPPASVTHPATLEETVYDRLFTADEVQALLQAATAPVLDGEIRVLQVLIRRVLAISPDQSQSRSRRRGGAGRRWQRTVLLQQIAAVGRAADVLQRLLKAQQALAKDSPSELYQLLDEAAKYMEDPSLAPDPAEDPVIEEYDPCTRTVRPMHEP